MVRMAIGRFAPVTFTQLESLTPALELALARLRQTVLSHPAVVVAYSGGVDSTLVAAIAVEQHGA
jgi:uncharacterized protein